MMGGISVWGGGACTRARENTQECNQQPATSGCSKLRVHTPHRPQHQQPTTIAPTSARSSSNQP